MSQLQDAIELATSLHKFQVDAAGEIYILHPMRVMLAVHAAGGTQQEQIAAILHDVVEDTPYSLNRIGMDFGNRVEALVDALSRRDNGDEPYTTYLSRVIAAGPSARMIKEMDINDNLGRLDAVRAIDPAKAERLERKYKMALVELWAVKE